MEILFSCYGKSNCIINRINFYYCYFKLMENIDNKFIFLNKMNIDNPFTNKNICN